MKKGIAIAGNMLVDFVKTLPMYPKPGMLATIESVEQAVGGCVPNTLLDLAAIGGGYIGTYKIHSITKSKHFCLFCMCFSRGNKMLYNGFSKWKK